jgi:hypothetical protein
MEEPKCPKPCSMGAQSQRHPAEGQRYPSQSGLDPAIGGPEILPQFVCSRNSQALGRYHLIQGPLGSWENRPERGRDKKTKAAGRSVI